MVGRLGLIVGAIGLLFGTYLRAQPVVNEVLANEPGGSTTLEWIELYNDSDQPVLLDGYSVSIGDNRIDLPVDITLAAGEFYIICRRLYATESSPGFESVWGDSSGFWGDSPDERLLQMPFEAAMSLVNDAGCVGLVGGGTVVSSLTWVTGGLDGCSWERVLPGGDEILQSVDPQGSTPGLINSVTPVPFDLALSDVVVESTDGSTTLTICVRNLGTESVAVAEIALTDGTNIADTIDVITAGPFPAGDSLCVDREYRFDGLYLSLVAALSDDDRNRNNVIEFIATGAEYPPLVLSEFLPNPQDGLGSEWLEVRNRSDRAIDLNSWRFGDALHLYPFTTEPLLVEPDEFVVLVQSETEFLGYYFDFDGFYIQPGSWASLNNDGDMVRLVDGYGICADRFEYDESWANNYTWCRSDQSLWGRSSRPGGSPGEVNEVLLEQTASSLTVNVDPEYISPDGDGFQDFTTITVSAPPADCYTVRIYDRQGRVVRNLCEEQPMLPASIAWDGLSDAGRRLAVGIYILYVEASGVAAAKQPIIIAR